MTNTTDQIIVACAVIYSSWLAYLAGSSLYSSLHSAFLRSQLTNLKEYLNGMSRKLSLHANPTDRAMDISRDLEKKEKDVSDQIHLRSQHIANRLRTSILFITLSVVCSAFVALVL